MKHPKKKNRRLRRLLLALVIIFFGGFILPENAQMPVHGATSADYHPESFWYYPWGRSGTHKGVDIFAERGTDLRPATPGIVISTGNISMGGNYILVLGAKWKLHYYAHLNSISTSGLSYVSSSEIIGTVGDSGNAAGKPPHLHYSIVSLLPRPWLIDDSVQGWKKMFYLNPIAFISGE